MRLFVFFLLTACRTEALAPTPVEHRCKPLHRDANATCDDLYADFAEACRDETPALADAMRAVSRDELLRTPPIGSEHWRAVDRKSFTLYQASFEKLPPECTGDFPAKHYPVDDYGRAVREITNVWQTDPRCRPFDMQGTVDVGVWSLATVLAPHLDAAGKTYLAKLMACEAR